MVKKSVSADRGVLLSEMQVSTGMKVFRAFNLLFLILVVFLTAYPFLNIIAQSFSSEGFINSGRSTCFRWASIRKRTS